MIDANERYGRGGHCHDRREMLAARDRKRERPQPGLVLKYLRPELLPAIKVKTLVEGPGNGSGFYGLETERVRLHKWFGCGGLGIGDFGGGNSLRSAPARKSEDNRRGQY